MKPSGKMARNRGFIARLNANHFTASFKPFPEINLRTHFALIVSSSSVRGFLPFQVFLFSTLNGPNPDSAIHRRERGLTKGL
jgi:hypothetical protein